MRFNWKTEKGNKIELVVETAKRPLTSDGIEYGKEEYKKIERFIANGKEFDATFITESMHHNYKDLVSFFVNGKEMLVIIPDEVSEVIWGEERRAHSEAFDRSLKIDQEYEEHYNKVLKTMGRG
jgi:vacuolar-type H+-ATPase subunit F/Vma7